MSLARTLQRTNRRLFARPLVQLAFGVVAVAVAFAAQMLLVPVGTGAIFVLFFGAVLVSSIVAGYRGGGVATVSSVPPCIDEIVVLATRDLSVAISQTALYAASCTGAVYLATCGARAFRNAEAAHRFRLANEAASIACWELDVATGDLRWSPPLVPPHRSPATLDSWREVLVADDRARFDSAHEQSLDPAGTGMIRVELRVAGPDGTSRWLSWVGRTYFGTSADAVVPLRQVGTAIDVTERKRFDDQREQLLAREQLARQQAELANAQLRESEERFRLTLDEAPIGMALVALDGRFIRVNSALCRLLGYSCEELLQRRFQDVTHPDDLERGQEISSIMSRGLAARFQLEKRYIRKDGAIVTALLNVATLLGRDGTPLYMVSQITDITEQRRVEREQRYLAEAGKILSSSLDYEQTLTTVGELVVRELANWCIIELAESDSRPRRLRIIPDDPTLHALVQSIEQLQNGPDQPHVRDSVWRTRQPVVYEHLRDGELDRFAQSPLHLELLRAIHVRSAMIVPLAIGERALGVLAFVLSRGDRVYTARDLPFATAIADRAALAIENGRLYHSAVQATRLRDQVLAVVAHDLRNPLSLIQLQANILEPPAGMAERRNPKPRQAILRGTARMKRLIDDLLDISQIEAGQLSIERTRVSTAKLLEDFVETEHRLATAASLELRLEREHELPDVWGDRDRITQVLDNATGNAIKFTPAGGSITIGARSRNDHVLFWVADTGSGMTADALTHIFDRFWQAKKGSRRGAGLGLPICRGIVEAHGGQIWAESSLGHGTTLFFTIPRAPSFAAVRDTSAAAAH